MSALYPDQPDRTDKNWHVGVFMIHLILDLSNCQNVQDVLADMG